MVLTIKLKKYNSQTEVDIKKLLEKKPKKHTFIFIKGRCRCAITLNQKFLGVLYENHTTGKPNNTTIIQGLLGRATGYQSNGKTIIYSDIDTIKLYKSNIEKKKEIKFTNWKCNTKNKKTFNHPSLYEGMNVPMHKKRDNNVIVFKTFKTHEEVKEYFTTVVKSLIQEMNPKYNGSGPNRKKADSNGYYRASIGHKFKNEICSVQDVEDNKIEALGKKTNHLYTCHAAYINKDDKSTLRFCLSHFKTYV